MGDAGSARTRTAAAAGATMVLVAALFGLPWPSLADRVARLSWPAVLAGAGVLLLFAVVVQAAWRGWRSAEGGLWGWMAVLITAPVVLFTAAALSVTLALLDDGTATVRVELVKTAFAVGAGAGGLVALVLAGRRQWSAERVANATAHDSAERRITELYAKAAEQLGSDKAAVRLAGFYALERLAQDNPGHRQTIVSLFCAYLRMPPAEGAEEDQVRFTAQRILAQHLRPDRAPGGQVTSTRFWPDADLDLEGAVLSSFSLAGCEIQAGYFWHARFTGREARFDRTRFLGNARFDDAEFGPRALFRDAEFRANVRFDDAAFLDVAAFGGPPLSDTDVKFGGGEVGGAVFHGDTSFAGVRFAGETRFTGAEFRRGGAPADVPPGP
jgi:hypothetical protein